MMKISSLLFKSLLILTVFPSESYAQVISCRDEFGNSCPPFPESSNSPPFVPQNTPPVISENKPPQSLLEQTIESWQFKSSSLNLFTDESIWGYNNIDIDFSSNLNDSNVFTFKLINSVAINPSRKGAYISQISPSQPSTVTITEFKPNVDRVEQEQQVATTTSFSPENNSENSIDLDNQEVIDIQANSDNLDNQEVIDIQANSNNLENQEEIEIQNNSDNLENQEEIEIQNNSDNLENQEEIEIQNNSDNLENQDKTDIIENQESQENLADTEQPRPQSPLQQNFFQSPSAVTLKPGEVVFNVFTRNFFGFEGSVADTGNAIYFTGGFRLGITDNFELSFDGARVDGLFPGEQGDFRASIFNFTNDLDANIFEFSLGGKYRIWQNESETQTLSAIGFLSAGNRGIQFSRPGEIILRRGEFGIIPALQIPYTIQPNSQVQFTVSPTVAFFQENKAAFLQTTPGVNGSFGTTFGLTGAFAFSPIERITFWGDAFIPFTGNNSISRNSGRPEKTIAFNAGIRYLVNPRLALDVFATNTFSSQGPLALTADRDFLAIGFGTSFMPDFLSRNRVYGDSFNSEFPDADSEYTVDGFGFIDGGTVPANRFLGELEVGSQGLMTSLRYGMLRDFEAGIFLDYIWGDIDESEQGFSGKIRLLNQQEDKPFTLSLATTLSLTSQSIVNFANNDRDRLDDLGLDNTFPFFFDQDDNFKLFVVTVSVPIHYQFDNDAAIWFTPTIGYLQRNGVEIAGFNVGGSFPIFGGLSVVAEVGANFVGSGNGFIGRMLADNIPWNVGFRWNPSDALGLSEEEKLPLELTFSITNRLGSSPWQQLRVRDQNKLGISAGTLFRF